MFQAANQIISKLNITSLLDLTQNEATGPKVLLRIQNKTASYTVLQSDSGTVFTNYGDTNAIVYTLPTSITKGWFALFINMVNYSMTVTNGTAGALITHDSLVANSVDFDTGSEMIGQAVFVFSNGSAFVALQLTAGTFDVNE